MYIDVNTDLLISGLSAADTASIKRGLTLVNPMFFKMRNMGKGTWGTPEHFKYYEEEGGGLHVPRGCLDRMKRFASAKGEKYTTSFHLVDKPLNLKMKDVTLRDYQKVVVDKVLASEKTEGIIVMSTGSGKTITALELIKRLGKTATYLVPNNTLLEQFVKEAENFYGITPAIINGDTKSIGSLTVATFQSLGNNAPLLADLVENTSVLVVDECQGVPSDKREEVVRSFKPSYLFGLSATPDREDGKREAIFFILGETLCEYQSERLKPIIELVYTRVEIPVKDYPDMIEDMVNNKSRNKLLVGLIHGEMLAGRKVLVLTKRIQHYRNLEAMLPKNDLIHYIDSDNEDRNALLYAFKSGMVDFSVIFGTTALLAVGTDIPSLDTLIIACDLKSGVLTTQSVGRVLRLFEGKPTPKIIDLCDNENPILKSQYYSRRKVYEANGWEIKF